MARRVILAAVVFLLVGVGVFLFTRPAPEPMYKGKSVSAWFNDFLPSSLENSAKANAARTAIRAIGTNAVPKVIELLRCRDSAPRKLFIRLAAKQKVLTFRFRPSAERLNLVGMRGAQLLGTNAGATAPYLTPFLNHSNYYTRMSALIALQRIGPEAKGSAPALFKVLASDPDPRVRLTAFQTIGSLRLRNAEVFPAVTNALSDGDRSIRVEVLHWLTGTGIEPSKLAPVFVDQLRGSDPIVKTVAMRELAWMKIDVTNAIPFLEQLTNDPDVQVKLAARGTLERLTGKHFPRPANEEAVFEYNFANTPISQVIQEYKSLVKTPVEVGDIPHPWGLVQIYTVGAVTKSEAIALIESALKNQVGVVVEKSADGTLTMKYASGNESIKSHWVN